MIGSVPSYHDFEKKAKKVLGRCADCGYSGPMEHGMTGYECARCHGMKLMLKLVDGRYWLQFTDRFVTLPEEPQQSASSGEAADSGSSAP